ncbi:Eukaryotic translation initiation factor 3 subunit G [Heracleum sosnowskyi]|uniref:Eukaryotic translation initiation factor 3 subunit G n=1 Tax=Heracleum sosnowskyi TaxID=360622 RepID=A0AAD8IL89_9APIA|nr:Eukaryotic translation initiation factor 3 subunit G [Heracleum sosnowskyi]
MKFLIYSRQWAVVESVEVRFHVSTAGSTPALRGFTERADCAELHNLLVQSRHMKKLSSPIPITMPWNQCTLVEKSRVTTTTRVRKFVANARKHVVERRAWRKFGDVVDEDVGAKLTMASIEDIFLERPAPYGSKGEEPKKSQLSLTEKGSGVLQLCRTCGKKGDHWTAQCPYKDLNQPNESFSEQPDTSDVTSVKDVKKGAYVPPSRRGGEKSTGSDMRRRTEENSVRVTNLSEDTREADLNELCSTFGPVTRTYVSNDQRTGTCRGFGFVNFLNRADAEKAIKVLNGYGYDNLILHVEWAASRKN